MTKGKTFVLAGVALCLSRLLLPAAAEEVSGSKFDWSQDQNEDSDGLELTRGVLLAAGS